MGYIYKITNDINDKVYIGQTSFTIQSRWDRHLRDSKRDGYFDRPLYRAINKYGVDKFHITEIEQCSDDLLNDRETYWIDYYNSYGKNGYNCTLGGDGTRWFDKEQIKNELLAFPYPILLAEKLGCSVWTIYNVAKEHNIPVKTYRHSQSVCQIDMDTKEIIRVFDSTKFAAE